MFDLKLYIKVSSFENMCLCLCVCVCVCVCVCGVCAYVVCCMLCVVCCVLCVLCVCVARGSELSGAQWLFIKKLAEMVNFIILLVYLNIKDFMHYIRLLQ